MPMKRVRIATRASRLALWQTRHVAATLQAAFPGIEVEEVEVVTKGDRVQDKPLYTVGGKALFVSEVERLVAEGRADLAVHSLKDVPGDQECAEGLGLIAFPEREDPRDVLISKDGVELMSLPAGARVGTTSLRRAAQLGSHRPDLAYVTLRGNLETRLGKLADGQYDAIVLAAAGMKRLGYLEEWKHQVLGVETCLPAVGQGTLAIEGSVDDPAITELVACLEHAPTRLVTEAERAMLVALEGSCRVPIAGHARLLDGGHRLSMRGMVGDIDGTKLLTSSQDIFFQTRDHAGRVEEAKRCGLEVAEQLIAQGARELMRQAEATILQRTKTQS